jgi:glyoxylase-like metal-dependent hydrolase (beta-lactamase superfamily II)
MAATFTPIDGNTQRLDGGSMFGNCPRAVWERWLTPDERHRVPLACRGLLVTEEGGRRILFETGIGAFFEPKLRDRFGVQEERHVLLDNLRAQGLDHSDIDVVVLSHLHFDHAGGLLSPYEEGAEPELLFPNARFVVGASAWERALSPHPRDRASFIPGLTGKLWSTERIELVNDDVEEPRSETLGDAYRFHVSHGHTPGMLLTEMRTPDQGPLVFAGDLIPGRPWMHLPITMGYDRFPERIIDEKTWLLEDLIERDGRLFFTHDHAVASVRVTRDEKGRFAGEPQPLA